MLSKRKKNLLTISADLFYSDKILGLVLLGIYAGEL